MIDAVDFAKVQNSGLAFGLDKTKTVETFKKLIATIESGGVHLQKIMVSTDIPVDDYAAKTITIVMLEKL